MNKILNELASWNIHCHIHNKTGFNSVTIKKKTNTQEKKAGFQRK